MRRDELRVEEGEARAPEPVDEIGERDLRGVCRRENMLSPKKAPPSVRP
jgi:hypothetical protein